METINELRKLLIDTMQGVKKGSIEPEKAKVIAELGQTVVNTAKVEVDFLKVTQKQNGTGFFNLKDQDNTPKPYPSDHHPPILMTREGQMSLDEIDKLRMKESLDVEDFREDVKTISDGIKENVERMADEHDTTHSEATKAAKSFALKNLHRRCRVRLDDHDFVGRVVGYAMDLRDSLIVVDFIEPSKLSDWDISGVAIYVSKAYKQNSRCIRMAKLELL